MSSVESGHVLHDDDDLYDAGQSIVENWELSQQDEMEVLKKRQNEMEEQIKELQCKLAGCGVAAMQNTRHTIARRIAPGEYGYSMSYAEVCRAVDREIALREQCDELLAALRGLRDAFLFTSVEVQADAMRAARAAIAKAGVAV